MNLQCSCFCIVFLFSFECSLLLHLQWINFCQKFQFLVIFTFFAFSQPILYSHDVSLVNAVNVHIQVHLCTFTTFNVQFACILIAFKFVLLASMLYMWHLHLMHSEESWQLYLNPRSIDKFWLFWERTVLETLDMRKNWSKTETHFLKANYFVQAYPSG